LADEYSVENLIRDSARVLILRRAQLNIYFLLFFSYFFLIFRFLGLLTKRTISLWK